MIIAPVIFCTVVHGIASMSDLKKLGRIAIKALVYFEVVSTLALVIGLVVINVLHPGAGFNIDVKALQADHLQQSQSLAQKAHSLDPTEFILNIIPSSFLNAFATGDILQVLLVAILSGFAISFMGERGKPVLVVIDTAVTVFFAIIRIIVQVAPIGAFGAMAFTIGSQGLGALEKLGYLMVCFYITSILFVVIVPRCGHGLQRLLHFPIPELYKGRAIARSRNKFVRNGSPWDATKNAASRLLFVDGRPGHSDGIQL